MGAAAARVFGGVNEEERQLLIPTRPLGVQPPPTVQVAGGATAVIASAFTVSARQQSAKTGCSEAPDGDLRVVLLVLTHKCGVVLWTDSPDPLLLTLISKYYISIVVCYISDKNHIIHPKSLR